MKKSLSILSRFYFNSFCTYLLIGGSFALTWALDNRTLTINEDLTEIQNNDAVYIDELHSKGVEAYLENDWNKCIKYFTIAAKEHRVFMKATAKCRNRCRSENNVELYLFPTDIENLHFYDTAVRTTLCLLRCKKATLNNKYVHITPALDKLYCRKKPYEYLHLCYYQKNMLQKAASACFTALVADPKNEIMFNNFKFYTNLPEVNTDKIENMERKNFVLPYIQGVEAYTRGDFSTAITFLEKSLKKWLFSADECRAYCEGPFDQGWHPDFISSVANHYAFCLRCKQKCQTSLNSLNAEYHDDMFPSHYHYLQYSYYKVSKLQEACKAVESYLLFFPNDETMLNNKKFYLKYLNGNKDYFLPREEALNYVLRDKYENKLLHFIDTEFKKLESADHEDETNEVYS